MSKFILNKSFNPKIPKVGMKRFRKQFRKGERQEEIRAITMARRKGMTKPLHRCNL